MTLTIKVISKSITGAKTYGIWDTSGHWVENDGKPITTQSAMEALRLRIEQEKK